ncbi:MAG: N-formylglutamate amidohydrolase [Sandaracinaceae bacterium]
MPSPIDFDRPCDPPFELVPVEGRGDHQLPPGIRERIAVYAVHDGQAIPKRFRVRPNGEPVVDPTELRRQFVEMRDWGANLVAEELTAALGAPTYASCRVARVLMDFNRFPGSTPPDNREALEALAIGPLYGAALDHHEKSDLLESFYDPISRTIESVVTDSLIGLSMHTYDEAHESQNKRAHVSIISLPLSYQRDAQLPYGVFDPMYPDHLAESTCSRILRDRMSLNLERSGFRVIHNHPYALPDGSIEMRAQVWHYFQFLRRRFEQAFPETVGEAPYERVFMMLADTNLRLAEAEELRSFLHRFRRVDDHRRGPLLEAHDAYQHVARFVRDSTVVQDYRRSPERPSSVGIEVRKDLVCTFDPETGMPLPTSPDQRLVARQIATAIASSIATYFETDREVYETASREIQLPFDEG